MQHFTNVKGMRRWAPLLVLMGWYIFTITVFYIGPIEYRIENRTKLIIFLFWAYFAIYLGYRSSTRIKKLVIFPKINFLKYTKRFLLLVLVFSILPLLPKLSNLFLWASITLQNALQSYEAYLEGAGISLRVIIEAILAPFKYIAIALGIFYWQRLSTFYHLILYLTISLSILGAIATATRSGIMNVFLLIFFSFICAYHAKNIVINRLKKLLILVLVAVFLISFYFYFELLTETRNFDVPSTLNATQIEVNFDKHFLKYLPERSRKGVSSFAFYASHAYSRLSSALELPFNGIGFGLANSLFLMRNFKRVTGVDLGEISYGARLDMQEEKSIGNYWSTIFTWFASDVTFPGVIVLTYMFGFILGRSWIDAVVFRSPLGAAALVIIAVFMYSFPFNNPLQDLAGITGFLPVPIIWWILRRKVKFPLINKLYSHS